VRDSTLITTKIKGVHSHSDPKLSSTANPKENLGVPRERIGTAPLHVACRKITKVTELELQTHFISTRKENCYSGTKSKFLNKNLRNKGISSK
jgi:hypothetical protein